MFCNQQITTDLFTWLLAMFIENIIPAEWISNPEEKKKCLNLKRLKYKSSWLQILYWFAV